MGHCANWKLPPYPLHGSADEKHQYFEESRKWRDAYDTCDECGGKVTTVRDYDSTWKDGDWYCDNGHFVRYYDAG